MYYVYKHTCPNKKVYIGITGCTPEFRWQGGYGYKENGKFFKDILYYGWSNIKHEILAEGLTKEEALNMESAQKRPRNLTFLTKGDAKERQHVDARKSES